jgi:diguanylate cyclase (GGDEF)-like protein/PAS domain S-box-containing protein
LTRRIGIPVIALFIIGVAGISAMTWLAARGRDEDKRAISLRNAVSALTVAEDRLVEVTTAYARWDGAVQKLHEHFDPDWALRNIALSPHGIYGVDHIFVFGPNNALAFQSHKEAAEPQDVTSDTARVREVLTPLVAAARAAAGTSDDSARAVWPVSLYGTVQLAAAAAIVALDSADVTSREGMSVLVFVRGFSPTLLARLAGDSTLPDLRVSTSADVRAGEMSFPLQARDPPAVAGYLLWRPHLPGTAMVHVMVVPLAMASLFMLGLLALVLRRARRAGLALDNGAAALRHARERLEVEVEERTADLRMAEARYRGIVENAVEGIFQITPEGRFISANPAMARILGFASPDRLIAGANADMMLNKLAREAFERVIGTFGEVVDFVSEVHRPDGTKTWISQNTRAVRNTAGAIAYYEGMAVDISARRQAEENLIKSAFHDALTGLPNRFLFFERLSQLLARGQRAPNSAFAALFLDCDRFKLINDSYGHLAGDNLLIALSQRLSHRLRPTDTLARLGGDEFAVLIEGSAMPASALALAERLHEACREPMQINEHEIYVSLSIGVACARSGQYAEAEAILRDADIAMYRAKDKGRNTTVLFEPGMHQAVVSRLEVEIQLRHALERGEFVVHYQPIFALKNKRIAGFEALVRWGHPSRGLVPPSDFIPTAEETGMIVPIGDWVLQEACAFAASWQRRHGAIADDLFMSVNLSPAQLDHHDAAQRVAAVLGTTGLPGTKLKLEITESAMMSNPLEVHKTLSDIAKLGVQLCVDDFGTGYSSLSYLHTFPVGTLKIDRTFTARLTAGREHVEMARTILLLGQNLGMTVIAEGIETAMQCDWFRAAGCNYGQGYYFGAAVDYCSASALLDQALQPAAATC